MKEILKMEKCDAMIVDQIICGYYDGLCIIKDENGDFFFIDEDYGHMLEAESMVALDGDLTAISVLPEKQQYEILRRYS